MTALSESFVKEAKGWLRTLGHGALGGAFGGLLGNQMDHQDLGYVPALGEREGMTEAERGIDVMQDQQSQALQDSSSGAERFIRGAPGLIPGMPLHGEQGNLFASLGAMGGAAHGAFGGGKNKRLLDLHAAINARQLRDLGSDQGAPAAPAALASGPSMRNVSQLRSMYPQLGR